MKSLLDVVFVWCFSLSLAAQTFVDQQPVKKLKKHEGAVFSLAFQPDGKILASGSDDKTCLLWSIPEGVVVRTIEGNTNAVQSVLFSPDGKYLLAGTNKYIKIYKSNGDHLNTYGGPATYIWSLAFNPFTNQIVAGSYEKNIRMVDFTTGKLSYSFIGHTKNALAVAFSPDGKWMASGSLDETIRIWDLSSKKTIVTCTGHGGNIYSLRFTPDSKRIISASNDNSVRVWDVDSGKTLMNLPGHTKGVSCLSVSPDGNYLLTGSFDTTIKLWELTNGECIYTFSGHLEPVNTVSFHPSGLAFASGSSDKTVLLWDISPEIFVEHYFAREFTEEVNKSPLFAPKAKDETKTDYKTRQEKAGVFRNEIVSKYFNRYESEIKGKIRK